MVLSSFTTTKQNAKIELSTDDEWTCIRDNVPYCDADKDMCSGYGYVWRNADTKQLAFTFKKETKATKYNLSRYRGQNYNYRFWYYQDSKYYYVSF